MNTQAMPQGDQWKNIAFVHDWKKTRRERLADKWRESMAMARKLTLNCDQRPQELVQFESETLIDRAHRIEKKGNSPRPSGKGAHFQCPDLITRAESGEWILQPAVVRATQGKITKSKRMWELGLDRKAQRELSCGLIAGEVQCRGGHRFYVGYECGNRYCITCGPKSAQRLFAKNADRLLFVATRLMLCEREECNECSRAIEAKELPHWPPPRGHKPAIVCAKLDFTLKNPGSRPVPEQMRQLNMFIKAFCRAIERRFKISRKSYGLAYCDELGGNNSNPHAHGIYVGPWLPQSKQRKELSALWSQITGGSFILSIKYARSFTEALYHAIKYPAKFAERSTPERLADLEVVFHRVRRFHTLAAFYNPEVPASEKTPAKRCPICEESLSEPHGWRTIAELSARGLRAVEDVAGEMARNRVLGECAPP
jgi:hypothetical protein